MIQYLKKFKGLLALTVVFSAISSLAYVFIAFLLQQILDIATRGDMDKFATILLFSICYFLLLGLFMFCYSVFSRKLICKVMNLMREKVFCGIIHRNIADFHKTNTADYLSALTNDVKMMEENYLLPLLEIIQDGIIFTASLIVMFYFDVLVAVSVLVAILIMFVAPSLFGAAMENRQTIYSNRLSQLTCHMKDILSGFEVIRSYGMKKYATAKIGASNQATTDAKYSVDKIIAANESVSLVLAILVQVVVIFLSAYFIMIGRTTVGTLMGMVQVAGNLTNPLLMIFNSVPKMKSVGEIMQRLHTFSDYEDSSFTGTIPPAFKTSITVKALNFGYTQDQPIISGIDFTFQKGRKYAIVGKSGCGKTTLINLLNGYYAGFEGDILYDGVGIRELDIQKLNEMSSVIHQNVYMFDESIQNNICLHKQISQPKLQRALDMSGVSMFLSEEKTLDTSVGENGNNLSGGQRQRIAVARALVQEKSILVLDEGTSAVDMQTAYDIESQLLKISDLTVMTITHSLNPELLKNYDQILFMENGTIAEAGAFDKLMETKGAFFDFFNLKTRG